MREACVCAWHSEDMMNTKHLLEYRSIFAVRYSQKRTLSLLLCLPRCSAQVTTTFHQEPFDLLSSASNFELQARAENFDSSSTQLNYLLHSTARFFDCCWYFTRRKQQTSFKGLYYRWIFVLKEFFVDEKGRRLVMNDRCERAHACVRAAACCVRSFRVETHAPKNAVCLASKTWLISSLRRFWYWQAVNWNEYLWSQYCVFCDISATTCTCFVCFLIFVFRFFYV